MCTTPPNGAGGPVDPSNPEAPSNPSLPGAAGGASSAKHRPGRDKVNINDYIKRIKEAQKKSPSPSGRDFDRGASPANVVTNHLVDVKTILGAIKSCFDVKPVLKKPCMCELRVGLFKVDKEPMREYWWPVQKIEVSHTPFTSAYWPKPAVKVAFEASLQMQIQGGGRWAQLAYQRVTQNAKTQLSAATGGIGSLGSGSPSSFSFNQKQQELAAFLNQNKDKVMRNPTYGQGPSYAEYHVFPEPFNNAAMRKLFNVNIRNKPSGRRDFPVLLDPNPWWKTKPGPKYTAATPFASEGPSGMEFSRNPMATTGLDHGRVKSSFQFHEQDPSKCAARNVGPSDDFKINREVGDKLVKAGLVAGETQKSIVAGIHGDGNKFVYIPPDPTEIMEMKTTESPKFGTAAKSGYQPVNDGGCLGKNIGPWVPVTHWHQTVPVFPHITRLGVMKGAKVAYSHAPGSFWPMEPWPYYESVEHGGGAFASGGHVADKFLWLSGGSVKEPKCELLQQWFNQDADAIPFDTKAAGEETAVLLQWRFFRTCPVRAGKAMLPVPGSLCKEKIE